MKYAITMIPSDHDLVEFVNEDPDWIKELFGREFDTIGDATQRAIDCASDWMCTHIDMADDMAEHPEDRVNSYSLMIVTNERGGSSIKINGNIVFNIITLEHTIADLYK